MNTYDNVLFEECMEALGNKALILHQEESDAIFEIYERSVPISWSHIVWEKVTQKTKVTTLDEVIPALENLLSRPIDPVVYAFWNNGQLPLIKTDIQTILSNFHEVVAYVGRETFLYNPTEGYAIELCRGTDEASIGLFPMKPPIEKPKPINSIEELEKIAATVVIDNPQQVAAYKTGDKKLLSFFMGEGMKKTNKMANAKMLRDVFVKLLDGE